MTFSNKIMVTLVLTGCMFSCTKLDENLNSTLTSSQASSVIAASGGATVALNGAYADIAGPYHDQDRVFSLQENTTDECLVPTRGSDWDDNGVWRVMHTHEWNANHGQITGTFNALLKIVFDATNVLTFKPTPQQAAEARFLRSFAMFQVVDFWGQVPFRQPGDNLLKAPTVLKDTAALGFIMRELMAIVPDLNNSNAPNRATKDAANMLLMKCYLNRAAFINRKTPTHLAADMQQVITLGQAIINSNKYQLNGNYYDNFGPNNTSTGLKEAIFSYVNTPGASGNGNINSRWKMTLHYNSYDKGLGGAGWNGFTTLSDFYSLFGATDKRREDTFAGVTSVSGLKVGFLVGQQRYQNGNLAKDRKGNNLSFTPQVQLAETEAVAIENSGIRVIKYPPDYANYDGSGNNDLMIYRYADVVLMVAEAQLRSGTAGPALVLVNNVRSARGAVPLLSLDLPAMLAERGREFYWEMQRRTDLIRFGVFLNPWQLKPTDNDRNLYFPIPASALAVNPNLVQNPGYSN